VGSPTRATVHGSMGSLRENNAAAHDKLTRWSSSVRVAPRRLAAVVGFVLHSGSMCSGSMLSPVTKRPQAGAGAGASPRARRCLRFARDSTELKLESGLGFLACRWKSQ
jgi:hypothetical protein